MGLVGASLIGASIYLETGEPSSGDIADSSVNPVRYPGETAVTDENRRSLATLTPTPTADKTLAQIVDVPSPTMTATPTLAPTQTPTLSVTVAGDTEPNNAASTPTQAGEALITQTLTVTHTGTLTAEGVPPTITGATTVSSADSPADITPEPTEPPAEEVTYVDPYTSTAQVQPPPSTDPTPEAESTPACPTESTAAFDLIPIEGRPMADHPDFLHGDLNLSLRGYTPVSESLTLVFYNGDTDSNAPRLHGLFEPNRTPPINAVYQVNEWVWDSGLCGGNPRGCRGAPVDVFWPVTLVGLSTAPGEVIYIPERGPEIHPGGYIAMALYAEERRITLAYTRRDNAAAGYIIHLENVCVDPNLLTLYQAQKNTDGWRTSGFLPALRNNQALGVAFDQEIRVAIRDAGSFMDPRSEKDWWR